MSGSVPPIEILYLTHNYPRYAGDFAGGFVARLAEMVLASGRGIAVLAPHHRDAPLDETMNGVRVRRFRYGADARETLAYQGDLGKIQIAGRRGIIAHYRFIRSFARAAEEMMAREKPRTIHAHWWIPAGHIARKLRFSGNLVVTLHGTDLRLLRNKRWLRPVARKVFDRASIVTVVSSWLASVLIAMFPGVEKKLRVTPMPPNDDVFHRGSSQERANEPPIILSVTRFTAQKRNNVLLHALAQLRDQGIAFRARLIGQGPLRHGIIGLVESLGLSGQVTLDGPVTQPELAVRYRAADVVVLPAVDEGFGMALVEAQLCGTAVVGVQSGGLPDIIHDGSTGLLGQPDDAADLARVLQRLLGDDSLRSQLAEAGAIAAAENFSSSVIVNRFKQWYDGGVDA